MWVISDYEEYYGILENLEKKNVSGTRKKKKTLRQLLSSGKTKDCIEKEV